MIFNLLKIHSNSTFPSTSSRQTNPIPFDILSHIFQYLIQSDLATLSRVSREYHLVTTPLLYREISIDLSKDVNPLLVRRKRILGVGQKFKKLITGEEYKLDIEGMLMDWSERYKEEERDKLLKGKREARRSKWLSRFKRFISSKSPIGYLHRKPSSLHVTYLTISNHTQDNCRKYRFLNLPNLIILHLIPYRNKTQFDYSECHNFYDHTHCNMDSECLCPLIVKLKPRRLILGSEKADYKPIDDIPTYPTKWLEELVVYASDYHMIQLGPSDTIWGDGTYGRLEKVTIVLQRAERSGVIGEDGVWQQDQDGDVRRKPDWPSDLLYERLAMVLEKNPGMMEVVGLEKTDWNWVGRPKLGDVEVGKREMKRYLVDRGWEVKDAENKVEDVRFTDKVEYRGYEYGQV